MSSIADIRQGVKRTDYLSDVKKYDAGADAAVVERIVKHLGIALRNRDSARVSVTDQEELDRVRDKWAVKKLGVDITKAEAAIAKVAKAMAADRSKGRVTFYYLVAKELGKLNLPSPALEIPVSRFGEAQAPFLSARRVAELLGVTLSELAGLIGVARNTLAAKAGARKVDAALSPVVRILAMAGEMAGDEQRAAIWFKHQPIPGWAGKTAYDLVHEGKADKVLAYLEAVRSGVYA